MELKRTCDLFRASKARSVALAAFMVVALYGHGQENDRSVRQPFMLELHVDSITIYQAEIDASRYVLDESTVQLHPGETLFLETKVRGSRIISMRSVKEIREPERTITVRFEQLVRGRAHDHMMLTIRNPFKQRLGCSISLFEHGAQSWTTSETLHYTASPEEVLYVTWPEPIVTMILMDWTLK